MYQAVLLNDWDHTTRLVSVHTDGKTPLESIHPFRSKSSTTQTSIAIPTKPIMQIDEYRDGERISILKRMNYGKEDLRPS